jgi:hypothetical protein
VNCRGCRESLSALLDGALPPPVREQAEAHLAQCPGCREALEELRRTLEHLHAVPPVEPPPWLAERIMARVRARPRPASGWRRVLLLAARPPLQAAGLVLLCLAGYLVLRVNGPRYAPPAPPAAADSFSPPPPAPGFAPEAVYGAPGGASGLDEARSQSRAKALGTREARPMALRAPGPQAVPELSYRLALRDPQGAGARVEAAVRAAGAAILVPPAPGRPALTARVPAGALPELLRRLKELGALEGPAPEDAGEVTLNLAW